LSNVLKARENEEVVTVKDVARRAGVSPGTVSRVINGRENVSPATREKVERALKELEYQCNIKARGLVQKKTFGIGVVLASSLEDLQAVGHIGNAAVAALERVFQMNGYSTLYITNRIGERAVVRALLERRVDALVFVMTHPTDEVIQEAGRISVPIILIQRFMKTSEFGYLYVDDYRIGFLSTTHLIMHGCKHIAHITRHETRFRDYPAELRKQGYVDALLRASLPVEEDMIVQGDIGASTEAEGYIAMKRLLHARPDVDGVAVFNDLMAIGAYRAISEFGRKIPDDIRIVAVDNTPQSRFLVPSLTTVDIPLSAMGQRVGQYLMEVLRSDEDPLILKEIMEPNLVCRESCGCGIPAGNADCMIGQ
jgi:DNA-binding LacI/PurR family transcriptional regulator